MPPATRRANRSSPAIRAQMSSDWAAMVRVVISSWRIRNIRSSSSSGLVRREPITCCSRAGSFAATALISPRWRRATAEVMAKDTGGVAGRNRPASMRRSTALGLGGRIARDTAGFGGRAR